MEEEAKKRLKEKAYSLLRIIEAYYNIEAVKILGRSRKKEPVFYRYVVYSLLREEEGVTLDAIARIFGRRHYDVIHGLKVFEDQKKSPVNWTPETPIEVKFTLNKLYTIHFKNISLKKLG